MSLFDDASLVLIPDGAKDGKLYSVKPTDGTGDFTFARGSNLAATRVDENGLIEKGRENLLLQSNQFDTTWVNANSTNTSGQSGYDGSSDAWLLSKTGANGRITQTKSISSIFTFSVYVKKGTTDWVLLYKTGTGEGGRYFDLTNGVIGSSVATAPIDSNIEDVGNGWYRCSIIGNSATAVVIYVADSNGSVSGTSGNIYIQDAQLEQGLVATDYIETGATTAQAGILEDLPRIDYSGGASCPALLLEPQRTNFEAHSEYLDAAAVKDNVVITSNATTSLEGVDNASNLVDNATSGLHRFYSIPSTTAASGVTMTHSIFAKANGHSWFQLSSGGQTNDQWANFDLTNGVIGNSSASANADIQPMGNGWYRCVINSTTSASSALVATIPTLTNDTDASTRSPVYSGSGNGVFLYGLQCEEGSYPTSYIPTYGSSVTRSVDGLSISDIQTNNLIGSNQGSFVFHYKTYNAYTGNAGEIYDFRIDSNNRMATYFSNGTLRLFSNIAGVTNFNQATTLDGDTEFKIGVAYDTNSTLVYINGALSYTLNSFDLGVTNFDIAPPADGLKIGDFSWFPTKLTATELAAITTI